MKDHATKTFSAGPRAQRGFTLVEMMVAIAIALFLLGGLFASVQSTKRAYTNQNLLSQLQDNERFAMTVMASVVEKAGYYPNPVTNSATTVLPVTATFLTAGQAVYGTYNAATPGDTLYIRYGAGEFPSDNVYNCLGTQNTTVPNYDTFTNEFYVNAATNQLYCQATTSAGVTTYPLANGVLNMSVLYGVKSGAQGDTGSCADEYYRADQVTANALWSAVCSVKVTLTFQNPMTPTSVGVANANITLTRVIAVMGTAGVNS